MEPPLATPVALLPDLATDPNVFHATIPMRSCALANVYEARIFIDGVIKPPLSVPPTGQELREINVDVDIRDVAPGCHKVEVYVSSRFWRRRLHHARARR